MIRLLLVDDHAVVRQGLRMFLELDGEMTVVGEACNGIEALQMTESLQPQVILMDLLMPKMGGIEAIRQIHASHPQICCLALTSALDENSIQEALRAGARGYLLKDTQAQDLCKAIRAALEGQIQLSPQATAGLVRELVQPRPSLTSRESEVLRLIANGASNKEIAADLGVTEKTIKTHVSNLFLKLGVESRTQAALYAVQHGIRA